jgi:hypothetical protein
MMSELYFVTVWEEEKLMETNFWLWIGISLRSLPMIQMWLSVDRVSKWHPVTSRYLFPA